jgi:hypothetical protein
MKQDPPWKLTAEELVALDYILSRLRMRGNPQEVTKMVGFAGLCHKVHRAKRQRAVLAKLPASKP